MSNMNSYRTWYHCCWRSDDDIPFKIYYVTALSIIVFFNDIVILQEPDCFYIALKIMNSKRFTI